jgi:malate dehydrogenase (oxaloacetate-decarboxylating)(NADP+)
MVNLIFILGNKKMKEAALRYHKFPNPGKLAIIATKPMNTKNDLALAYSPGVATPCELIEKDPRLVFEYTAKGNLVAVISNGTAVLGLGDIGALASKPVMEGKAALFKKFANVDVFDIEINEKDPTMLIEVIARLEPTFGGINLEDIKAPECFEIEQKLCQRMKIPVFHDDQHGTAIVVSAALINALHLIEKKIEDIKLVTIGAGAAGIACLNLLRSLGLKRRNITLIDSKGVVYSGRDHVNSFKQHYAHETSDRTIDDAIGGADVFLGLSKPSILSAAMVGKMADQPLIFALANPEPEIRPELVHSVRTDAIIATGRSDYPNQVNNVLCFPFLFRGALDVCATTINEKMKMAAVYSIANLARKAPLPIVANAYPGENLNFGRDNILPKPFDPRLVVEVASAVAKAAIDSGVAARPIDDLDAYKEHLSNIISK